MRLGPYARDEILTGQTIISWESITEDHVENSLLRQNLDPIIFDLDIRANVVGQSIPVPELQPPEEGGRLLQSTEAGATLVIVFDIFISYRSVGKDYDMPMLVFDAWLEESDRNNYVATLRGRSDDFIGVSDVEIDIQGFTPPDPEEPEPSGDDGNANVAIIAGAAVGGVAVILLAGLLLMRRRNSNKEEEPELPPAPTSLETPASRVAVSTEIMVEPQDDISTLGDPMFGPGGMLMGHVDKDEVTASVGEDYDYAKQYRHAFQPGSVASKSTPRDRFMSEEYTKASSAGLSKVGDNSLFADDSSFEQQFAEPEERYDVVAPAGKLGMVIDTPNGGPPVVHAIKDTSVLADRVQVGDRLLSVDGEDCTGMTAMQVSKLISLKSEKPSRVLVFVRARANTMAGP